MSEFQGSRHEEPDTAAIRDRLVLVEHALTGGTE